MAWRVVCDGMGGAQAGNVASKLAVETLPRPTWKTCAAQTSPETTGKLLLAAAADANRVGLSQGLHRRRLHRHGDDPGGRLGVQGETLEVVNVGDSRAYLIRPGRHPPHHPWTTPSWRISSANGRADPGAGPATIPSKNLITRALGAEPAREGGPLPARPLRRGMRCCCAPTV